MQINKKNDIDFITDILWQKSTDNNKINLKKYKKNCQFDYFCRTSAISSLYGFLKSDGIKLKNPVSLALYILESLEIEDGDDNVFLCFKFDEDKYGYILFYRKSILAKDGEYIGSEEEVMTKMLALAKRYNIQSAKVPDDVPFYNNQNFIDKSGLNITVINSHRVYDEVDPTKTLIYVPASEFYFWSNENKKHLQKAKLMPLVTLSKPRKIQLAILGGLLVILSVFYIKNTYFANDNLNQIAQTVIKPPVITAVTPDKMINACLQDIDKYMGAYNGWELLGFKCGLSKNGYDVEYKSQDGRNQDLTRSLKEPNLKFNNQGAKLHKTIKITKDISASKTLISAQVDFIKDIANKLNLKVTFNSVSTGSVTNINKNSVEIISLYSPMFLYQNGVLVNLNISEINMQPQAGFYQWTIKGELNGI